MYKEPGYGRWEYRTYSKTEMIRHARENLAEALRCEKKYAEHWAHDPWNRRMAVGRSRAHAEYWANEIRRLETGVVIGPVKPKA